MKGVTIDKGFWDQLTSSLRRWRFEHEIGSPSILAIDSGSHITGWCHFDEDGTINAGEGSPRVVIRDLVSFLSVVGAPFLFVREGPYTLSIAQLTKPQDPRKPRRAMITPLSIYRLGVAAGYVTGGIDSCLGSPVFWEPAPMSWRSIVGLNRQSTEESTARDETAAAILEYARRKTGLALTTEGEREKVDEANAIAMCFAGAHLMRHAESGGTVKEKAKGKAKSRPT